MPLITYCESVCTVAIEGRFRAVSPMMAAISSMRLLVVAGSDPDSSLREPFQLSSTPQPPGPGLPRQAPSVWMMSSAVMLRLLPRGRLYQLADAGGLSFGPVRDGWGRGRAPCWAL